MKLGYRPNRIEQLVIIRELEDRAASRVSRGSVSYDKDFIVHHVLTDRNDPGKMHVQIEYRRTHYSETTVRFERVWI